MGRKVTREDIVGATGRNFLFNDLSVGLFADREGEQLDGFFREFFEFIFNSELYGDKKKLIGIQMDRVWTKQEFSDSVIMAHGISNGLGINHYGFYKISHKQIRCEIWWNVLTPDWYTALFASGFAAYALKNDIDIQNSSFTDGAKCYDYFPAVVWLRENRGHKDYDYILGKLYDYTMTNGCLDKLLDFYDGLTDMEGKAEFLNYCGRRGQFEREEMRL